MHPLSADAGCKEIVTVGKPEGADGSLHPVQRAMVDCHASQCGFCTPGFVMSLFGLYLNNPNPDRDDVVDVLSGTCAVHGYRLSSKPAAACTVIPNPPMEPRRRAERHRRRAPRVDPPRGGRQPAGASGYLTPQTLDQLARAYGPPRTRCCSPAHGHRLVGVTKQMRELPPLIYLGDVRS